MDVRCAVSECVQCKNAQAVIAHLLPFSPNTSVHMLVTDVGLCVSSRVLPFDSCHDMFAVEQVSFMKVLFKQHHPG